MKQIVFLGDLFYDYNDIHEDIITILRAFKDCYIIVNLEGPISNAGNMIKKRGPNLYQNKTVLDILSEAGVYGVCLANNHTMDYGEKALNDTIGLLAKKKIKHTGAGNCINDACIPIKIDDEDIHIDIYNFGWDVEEVIYASDGACGCAPKDEKIIIQCIKKSIEHGRRPIVTMHWGFEYNLHPQPIDRALAYRLIDAGAELIIGHHPHVCQGKEKYNGKWIYYSLGNFYFSSRRDLFNKKFNTQYINESDYGLGIRIDLKNISEQSIVEYSIKYNKNIGTSILLSEQKKCIDYTEVKCNRQYVKMVRKDKLNHNPIISERIVWNRLQLFAFKYLFRGMVRYIWKTVTRKKYF